MKNPKIRFKGFADDWEQYKLNNICKYISSPLTVKDVCKNGKYDLYDANELIGKTNKSPINDNYISIIKDGAGVGRVRKLPKNTSILGTMGAIIPTESNYDYLFYALEKIDFSKLTSGGTIPHIYFKQYGEEKYFAPKPDEQEKIGAYFSRLDNLITLHQRKCEETKTLKKYMLQKMFPQDGTNIPEIRFNGFTGAWEQHRLGDIVERITMKNQDLVSTLPLTISAQYGLIDQNEFFDKRVASKDVSGYYLIKKGEFAYNKSTSTDAPWGAVKRLDRYENGVLSTLYIVFKIKDEERINSDYLVSYYDTDLWYRGIREIATEGARNHGLLNIATSDFFETKLIIPQDIEEQKRIGKYFNNLNQFLTFHQQKCDELQSIKKFMLQNMFV